MIKTFLKTENYSKGRDGYTPKAVVLHITDSTLESAISTFQNPKEQKSAHYLVADDGTVYQFVAEIDTAWHAGKVVNPTWKGLIPNVNPNLYTIGIETALTSKQFPSWTQWTTVAKLVKDICFRWNIPMDEIGIVEHREIRSDKVCPGTWISRFFIQYLIKIV